MPLIPATTELPSGEIPTWKSPNELIHERINFDDTIWGFGLAGGAYYNTPLRVTYVRPGSRGEQAHIYPGDTVLKINGIDSSKLTLEEAHRMILESGIHLQISVTSPEDLEEGYYVYQDPLEELTEEERKAREKKQQPRPKPPKPSGKSSYWGLQWPWKTKRKIIYKESNCYLVPSKFEDKHKDKIRPVQQEGDIVLDCINSAKQKKTRADAIVSKEESNSANSTQKDKEVKEADDLVKENEEESIAKKYSESNNNDTIKDVNDVDKDNVDNKDSSSNEIKKGDTIETNVSEKKVNEESVTDQDSSTDKNSANGAEQNVSEDAIHNDDTEQNDTSEKINDADRTEINNSLDKTQEDGVTQHNGSSDTKNNEHVSSSEGNIENGIEELNNSNDKEEERVEDVQETNNAIDNEEIVTNGEASVDEDLVKIQKNDSENIPGVNQSEEIDHNSR